MESNSPSLIHCIELQNKLNEKEEVEGKAEGE